MEEKFKSDNSEYIREQVKNIPLNRKKLLRRTLITAIMAVVFGVFACLSFLILEPVFSNLLYPEEEPEPVVIEQDDYEILPEDLPLTDDDIHQDIPEDTVTIADEIKESYGEFRSISKSVERSLVTITTISNNKDWWGGELQDEKVTIGVYVAENTKEILILAKTGSLDRAESIRVRFANGKTIEGSIKESDNNSGLSIIAVNSVDLKLKEEDNISKINLGNSRAGLNTMDPVIAIGNLYGTGLAVASGAVTSKDNIIYLTDANYRMFTTDIYGGIASTGIIVNLQGELLGLIDFRKAGLDTGNLVTAIGISDIKGTIERMSNGNPKAVLGVNGRDISSDMVEDSNMPAGVYITGIELDSPAMIAGIQSGDMLKRIDNIEVSRFSQVMDIVMGKAPEDVLNVVIARLGQNGFREINLSVTLGKE